MPVDYEYSYYSKKLRKVFDSLDELIKAEAEAEKKEQADKEKEAARAKEKTDAEAKILDLKKQLEEVLKKRDELSTKLAEAQREYNRKFCERKPLSANEFLEAMSKLFW